MDKINIPRIVVAGTSSGVGKTTIVTGLLGALKSRGLSVQSYKVGPDYIDPGYHYLASGKYAHNLDTWLVPQDKLGDIFVKTALDNDLVVIEGVMGLYDGGRKGVSSTAAIAKLLDAPVLLVIDAKSMGESAAAIALGYKLYDAKVNLAGVILNRLGSDTHKKIICSAMANLGIEVFGCIYRDSSFTMPERHLGLTPITENNADTAVEAMISQIANHVNIDRVIEIANNSQPLKTRTCHHKNALAPIKARIGVAQDEAFSFYYPESLDVLVSYGAEIVPFSPLYDNDLPNVDGIILGGGFPEMFVDTLAKNTGMRKAIYHAFRQDMPIYAECGGLMYLARQIQDFSGLTYDMVGAIPAICTMETKLQTVGYVEATALKSNILCNDKDILRGHEFHFSRMIPDCDDSSFSWAFEFKKIRTEAVSYGGFSDRNLLASYLHMHFAGNQKAAASFIASCQKYRESKSC